MRMYIQKDNVLVPVKVRDLNHASERLLANIKDNNYSFDIMNGKYGYIINSTDGKDYKVNYNGTISEVIKKEKEKYTLHSDNKVYIED